MNTTQIIVIVVLAVILLILIALAVSKSGGSKTPPPVPVTGSQSPQYTAPAPAPVTGCTAPDTYGVIAGSTNDSMILKIGDRGPEVAKMQRMLRSLGQCITVDGIFGNQTQTALKNITGKQQGSINDVTNRIGTAASTAVSTAATNTGSGWWTSAAGSIGTGQDWWNWWTTPLF